MIASLQFSSETICSCRKPILFVLLFLIGRSRDLLTLSLQTIFYQWVRRDSILYRFVLYNKSRRDPMFEFELDESLFKLAVKRPHFEPLFQLPPCWKTRFYCSPYKVLSVLYRPTYAGEKIPRTPLGGDIKQARPNARARGGRGIAQSSRKETTARAIVTSTAE